MCLSGQVLIVLCLLESVPCCLGSVLLSPMFSGLAVNFDCGIFLAYSFVLYKGEGSKTEGTWQAAKLIQYRPLIKSV